MAKIIDIIAKYPLVNKQIKVGKQIVKIKTYLSIDDYASCIYTVVNTCFKDGNFRPEFKEAAKRYAYIRYFTDIELDDISVEELFKTSQTDWWRDIFNEIITVPIFMEIERTIDELIQIRLDSKPSAFDNLCSDLSAILSKGNSENLADIKEVLEKLNVVDKDAFVGAITENVIAKTEGGEGNGLNQESTD